MASPNQPSDNPVREDLDAQTVTLQFVAVLLAVGALYLMGTLFLPFVLALVLTIALSPVANWFKDHLGLGDTFSCLLCTLAVALVLASAVGLITYQAGTILQQSDRYLERFSQMLTDVSERTGGDRLMKSLGLLKKVVPSPSSSDAETSKSPDTKDSSGQQKEEGRRASTEKSDGSNQEESSTDSNSFWRDLVRRNVRALGRWAISGLGGLMGFLGGVILFLSFLFYMLQTRGEWVERITLALVRLGMNPEYRLLETVQGEIQTFIGCLSLVSLGYVVLVSLVFWAIGIPQPLLWGVLTGLLEFIPYFGPLIAAILPTIVALSLGSWWQPLAVIGQFLALHTLEGYVITPLLYGRAVQVNPVTVLFGILFFGWLWGPLGMALTLPMIILLRGLVIIAPDTPALDALVDAESEKAEESE